MHVIIMVEDSLIRDQIEIGFQHCPGIQFECAEAGTALERIRQGDCDCVFVEHDAHGDGWEQTIRRIQDEGPEVEIVLVGDARFQRQLAKEKRDLDVHNFLATPVEGDAFYRLVGRLRSRHRRSPSARDRSPLTPLA